MKCKMCSNYLSELDTCKFCSFEPDDSYARDDWDILDLDDDVDWSHFQILNRLHSKGIECIYADIWFDKNMAYLSGCFADSGKIAKVLGLHEEVVYGGLDNGLVILNLYQEKHIRKSERINKILEEDLKRV